MALYKRGGVWWFKFRYAGRVFRESAKTTSKKIARDAERQRHRDLEESVNGLKKRAAPMLLSVAADAWLADKRPTWAPKTDELETRNVGLLKTRLGALLLCDIDAADVARYQDRRRTDGASNKTINLEVGTLRAILRRHRLWGNIQPDVRPLKARTDVGRVISEDEETRLLTACAKSRSRALYTAVTVALNTGMRESEIRLLRWRQVDFDAKTIQGRSVED